jgi:hypothetical protein
MTRSTVKTILILTANPKGTTPLRLDQEVRDISEGLKRSQHRDAFRIEQRWAVRPRDVQRAMLDLDPQIVHFSGHGEGEEGLAFEDESGKVKFVDAEALAGLFELFADQVECIVLNACYSEVQAEAICQHIPSVIGMKKEIGDRAALEFAVGFYDALGAGRSIQRYSDGRHCRKPHASPQTKDHSSILISQLQPSHRSQHPLCFPKTTTRTKARHSAN